MKLVHVMRHRLLFAALTAVTLLAMASAAATVAEALRPRHAGVTGTAGLAAAHHLPIRWSAQHNDACRQRPGCAPAPAMRHVHSMPPCNARDGTEPADPCQLAGGQRRAPADA